MQFCPIPVIAFAPLGDALDDFIGGHRFFPSFLSTRRVMPSARITIAQTFSSRKSDDHLRHVLFRHHRLALWRVLGIVALSELPDRKS
jgi:hypothetical protein